MLTMDNPQADERSTATVLRATRVARIAQKAADEHPFGVAVD